MKLMIKKQTVKCWNCGSMTATEHCEICDVAQRRSPSQRAQIKKREDEFISVMSKQIEWF